MGRILQNTITAMHARAQHVNPGNANAHAVQAFATPAERPAADAAGEAHKAGDARLLRRGLPMAWGGLGCSIDKP